MSAPKRIHSKHKSNSRNRRKSPVTTPVEKSARQVTLANLIQLARVDPGAISPAEMLELQRAVGNRAVDRLVADRQPPAGSGAGNFPIQRALTFEGTDWKSTKQIRWVKGQDHPDHDNVLMYKGRGQNQLWVKTDETPAETMAAANLINKASQTRQGKADAAGQGWSISTPQVREATNADRRGMSNKVGFFTGPKHSTRKERNQLKNTLRTAPVLIMTHAGGESAEVDVNPAATEPWRTDPTYRRTMGYVGLLDVILGNFDRVIGFLAAQNWKIDRPAGVVHLMDNIERGAFEGGLAAWQAKSWVRLVKARNWNGLKEQLSGNWMFVPNWDAIPAAEKETWLDGFVGGMQEALADLDNIRAAVAGGGPASPETNMLLQRIDHLRG